MKEILKFLSENNLLSKQAAKDLLINISKQKYNEYELAALMSIYLVRNISMQELQGFQEALLELYIPVDLKHIPVMDIVGTGGDGKDSFNISTLASFVVASMGHPVAKHGNYGASTTSGASNVMEQIGYKFKNDPNQLLKEVETTNFCFLHAPLFHPALKIVAPIRKGIKIRTFFNLLGPLVNPANPTYQMIGVYNLEIARMYNYILQQTKKQFTIVHCLNGYDEISLTNETKIITEKGDYIFKPSELSPQPVLPNEILGGQDIETAKNIFLNVLQGTGTIQQNAVVLANAATASMMTGNYSDYKTAYQYAEECLLSGKSYQILKKLLNIQ